MTVRNLSPLDRLLVSADTALRTVFAPPRKSARPSPSGGVEDEALAESQRRESAALMRVNHAGEVAAQALYQGHAVTARSAHTRIRMEQSALEEVDHLVWCQQRIEELDGKVSILNPIWYGGSFAIGVIAGLAGDRWNLGFVAETERQVIEHIDRHLARLSENDHRSRAILEQMREEEAHHATLAKDSGAAEFPPLVKQLMKLTSKIMTETAYKI